MNTLEKKEHHDSIEHLRLDCAYDGTNFHGWATQPRLRTVQGVLEESISKLLHVRPEDDYRPLLVVAGRTDAGVHARAQVAHVDIPSYLLDRCVGYLQMSPIEALERRLRFIVPSDIAIHGISRAPKEFDARFSAMRRTYRYRIQDCWKSVDPLIRNFVIKLDQPLDEKLLHECAAAIPGLKDFGSFAIPNIGGTTIRKVEIAKWYREDRILIFEITADAFARSMVRSLVGAQIQVGLHKKTVQWFCEKLATPQREGATGVALAQGLTLENIEYPSEEELGIRAQKIRARRTLESDAS